MLQKNSPPPALAPALYLQFINPLLPSINKPTTPTSTLEQVFSLVLRGLDTNIAYSFGQCMLVYLLIILFVLLLNSN